ncbi:rhamnogalacturonan lyase [Galbibacter sp.]|uniref:rhamnogalacturonan lyase n=1 Tax=Galbibacter sp. TaxID=2918471 RepID=UPI003A950FFD
MKKYISVTCLFLLIGLSVATSQVQMEKLNRALIAIRTGDSEVYLGWRLFKDDPKGVGFNLYRDGVLLNDAPIVNSTNYLDKTKQDGVYTLEIATATDSKAERKPIASAELWSQNYLEIPLDRPKGGTTPDGVDHTYSPNDASVADLDGDGEYEIVLKWAPSNGKDNSHEGYTGNVYIDAYKFSGQRLWRIDLGVNIRAGAHYTQFIAYDLDGDGKAEVACKTADGTKDGLGNILGDGNADYRNAVGRIIEGPEYLSVFDGLTGGALSTVLYVPERGDVGAWGDVHGNRVDRFLAAVAYLDGKHPSLVMCRGYYTRSVIAAWDLVDGELKQRWVFDSDSPGNEGYAGQGNHNLSIADVDGDSKQEIIYGSMSVDDDGQGLYTTGLGHGDALHVSDFDPSIPGLEVFMPHENKRDGITFRKAKTGEVIWQHRKKIDVGRGLAADIDSSHVGAEFWAQGDMGVYNVKGGQISDKIPPINFAIWWDGDLQRELLDGNRISKYGVGIIFTAEQCLSNNWTKATPCLQADLFGDWREEVIFRTQDNNALRIYMNPEISEFRIPTLMQDLQYRMAVVWQNSGYNQPPWPSFYIGSGMSLKW